MRNRGFPHLIEVLFPRPNQLATSVLSPTSVAIVIPIVKGIGVAMLAAGGDLEAAPPQIECVVAP